MLPTPSMTSKHVQRLLHGVLPLGQRRTLSTHRFERIKHPSQTTCPPQPSLMVPRFLPSPWHVSGTLGGAVVVVVGTVVAVVVGMVGGGAPVVVVGVAVVVDVVVDVVVVATMPVQL